ncbi:MAG: redoxin domain-containing protein [Chitinophagaceae bacterium]|nr:redoxin domain-containing protein [Chitinophagaceae bacterium]
MKNILAFICVLFFIYNGYAQDIKSIKAPDLVKTYESGKGVMVINFWSTWCKPCIEEIPHFLKVYEELKSKGVELWLVSQDTRELYNNGKLGNYIKSKEGWNKAKLFWFDETNADYYCPIIDKNWSGVIPATLIVNPAKGYRKFIEESMSAEQLMKEIEKAF